MSRWANEKQAESSRTTAGTESAARLEDLVEQKRVLEDALHGLNEQRGHVDDARRVAAQRLHALDAAREVPLQRLLVRALQDPEADAWTYEHMNIWV